MPLVVQYREALQYDGTNGSYICETWSNVTLSSDDGNALVFLDGEGNPNTINNGDWVVKTTAKPVFLSIFTNAEYQATWVAIP